MTDAASGHGGRGARGPLFELTLARMLEAVRDPQALFWTFGFPVFLSVVLGLAFRSAPPEPQRVALVCEGAGECQTIRGRLTAVPAIRVSTASQDEALAELGRGKLELVLQLRAASQGEPRIAYHYDPARKEARWARLAVERAIDPRPAAYSSRDVHHQERGARYIDYLMPGLVGLNLMGGGVWGIGFAIVDSRRRKLMRQLATTPMRRTDFLLSYMLSRLILLVPEVAFLFGFGVMAFGTPMRGSLVALSVLSIVGAFAFTALGILVGSRAESSEAASGWANFVMMPMWLFSGVFFSYELFPAAVQPLIHALPLTALADSLRAVANEGATLADCAGQLSVLGAWTVGSFLLALKLFRWK